MPERFRLTSYMWITSAIGGAIAFTFWGVVRPWIFAWVIFWIGVGIYWGLNVAQQRLWMSKALARFVKIWPFMWATALIALTLSLAFSYDLGSVMAGHFGFTVVLFGALGLSVISTQDRAIRTARQRERFDGDQP